jgi:voltage-gated potassium channel
VNTGPRAERSDSRLTFVKGPGLAIALFFVVVVVGTVGYIAVEGWSLPDAFYMTMITVTTVGYREVHPMSRAGEAWTVFVLLGGVATLFYTASTVMALVVEGGLHTHFARRRFNRMLEALSEHFIICGYGRIGSIIATW